MTALPFAPDDHGGLLYLRVTPRSAGREITGLHHGADGRLSLQVKVTAQPEKGRANEAVIELLAEAFDLPKRAFVLTAGETDRLKTISIDGNPATIARTLQTLIQDRTS